MKRRIAIITGATGGMGREFVAQVIDEVDEIWAVGRDKGKLSALKQNYGNSVSLIACDLTEKEGINRIKEKLQEEAPVIQYLVNNAGTAKMASYKEFTMDEISNTIDLNCKAPVLITNLCIPYMERGSKILNIASASAFQPNPYINLYASSKAFEMNYSRALNAELKNTGIQAIAICPGWVDTELLIKEIKGKQVRFPGIVSAHYVVAQALRDTKKGKDLSIPSLYVKCQYIFVTLLPKKLVMGFWMKGIREFI